MSSRSPVSSTWANRVLGSSWPMGGAGCSPAAGASPLAEADPVGAVAAGAGAGVVGGAGGVGAGEWVGPPDGLSPGEPIGDSADGSVDPGADCPPRLDGLPITITVPAGRS